MDKSYLIIYAFMMLDLSLKGVVRDVFAAIFNFWIKAGKIPVHAPFRSLKRITGASRPSISVAIAKLEDKGLLSVQKSPGKRSMYEVHLPETILNDFEETFHKRSGAKSFDSKNISPKSTDSNSNINKTIKNGQTHCTPLSVGDANAFDASDKL